MSNTQVAVLEALGWTVLLSVLGFAAQATNIAGLLPAQYVPFVAMIASSLLTALSQQHSAVGTSFFGYFGRARY